MNQLTPFRLLLLFAVAALSPGLRADAPPADTRAAFLQLLDRPRVDLAPEIKLTAEKDGLLEYEFSYAAEAAQRVPGLLVKPAAALPARRAAVISLHGTGNDKRGQLKLLRSLAAAGFVAVAIDTRHHGARSSGRKDNADYTDGSSAPIARAELIRFFTTPCGTSRASSTGSSHVMTSILRASASSGFPRAALRPGSAPPPTRASPPQFPAWACKASAGRSTTTPGSRAPIPSRLPSLRPPATPALCHPALGLPASSTIVSRPGWRTVSTLRRCCR